ncbi:MAG: HEAT repeat domain-containing protein [Acidobacteriota bacterium]|nr:HEAT repeat domain-containing protein [Acidobacteriota bacterium]
MKNMILIAVLLTGAIAGAQNASQSSVMPQTVNGKVVTQTAAGTLGDTIKRIAASGQAAWVAYAVPVSNGEHHMCCFNARSEFRGNAQCCGGCRLESGSGDNMIADRLNDCHAPLADSFFVLVRVGGGQVQKIRPASADCGLDLGGLTLYWLGEAKPAESLAWLTNFAARFEGEDRADRHLADTALTAIAYHKDAGADAVLQRFIAPQQPRKLRQQAAFWLGNARGQHGFEILRDTVRKDNDPKFREEATFAISQSDVPEAQPELIRMARQDSDSEVRSQALFWLGQEAGRKIGSVISDAIENDPDTDVKRKAVFALSQMDHDEGVPLLINVAKTHKNPAVRKEALFWLGQSGDARALDYIESILKQ